MDSARFDRLARLVAHPAQSRQQLKECMMPLAITYNLCNGAQADAHDANRRSPRLMIRTFMSSR
jgi:hypothetical protein